MCRPRLPHTFASGWHLHQSLLDRKSGKNVFVSDKSSELLSPLGRHFLAGLLAHARAAAAFTTPTINGYKRYHGVNSMAPIQAIWANDNRGVMVRVMGAPGDPATHLENRVGEPLANPYLYMASQIHAGLDGIARKLDPGPSADAPYEKSAEPLPASLAEALAALTRSECFRAGFGEAFVDYYARIKEPRSRAATPRAVASPAMRPTSPRGSTRSISILLECGKCTARSKLRQSQDNFASRAFGPFRGPKNGLRHRPQSCAILNRICGGRITKNIVKSKTYMVNGA